MMEAAFELSFSSMNMEFTIHLTTDGCPIPGCLFIDIVPEKCLLLQHYVKSAIKCLTLVANVNQKTATIKFIDQDIIEPLLLQFTILNLEDLEEQFFTLWMKAHKVLKAYNAHNNLAELEHIVRYYHSTEYREMMCACLL